MYPSIIKQPDLNRIRSRSHPQLKFASHPSALYQWEGDKIQSTNQMCPKGMNKDWNPDGRIFSSVCRKNVSRSARSTSSFHSNLSSRSMPNIRNVPAFTPASRMKNTTVIGPPKIGIFRPRPSAPTTFRRMYERGDIPVTLHHDHRGHSLRWKVDLDKIDYHHYLPLFFDGLRETKHPYDFFARAGVTDLLARGGERIVPVIPQLILPLKNALNTREPRVICTVLQVVQELVTSSPHVGETLVPYYRQLLPTLNLFKNKNINLGDEIDYSQRRQENLGDLIQDTLELLERRGGRDAYINIKYMVPTYQSCVN